MIRLTIDLEDKGETTSLSMVMEHVSGKRSPHEMELGFTISTLISLAGDLRLGSDGHFFSGEQRSFLEKEIQKIREDAVQQVLNGLNDEEDE